MSLVIATRNIDNSITLTADSGAVTTNFHIYPCGEKKIEQLNSYMAIGVVGECLPCNKAMYAFDWVPPKTVKTSDEYFVYLIRKIIPVFLDEFSLFVDENGLLSIECLLVFKDKIFHIMDDGCVRIVPTQFAAIGCSAEALGIFNYCNDKGIEVDITAIFHAVKKVNSSCLPHRIDSITIIA